MDGRTGSKCRTGSDFGSRFVHWVIDTNFVTGPYTISDPKILGQNLEHGLENEIPRNHICACKIEDNIGPCLFIFQFQKRSEIPPLLGSFRKLLLIRGFLFEFSWSSLKFWITIWIRSSYQLGFDAGLCRPT